MYVVATTHYRNLSLVNYITVPNSPWNVIKSSDNKVERSKCVYKPVNKQFFVMLECNITCQGQNTVYFTFKDFPVDLFARDSQMALNM